MDVSPPSSGDAFASRQGRPARAGDVGNCSVSTDTLTGNLLDGLPGTIAVVGDLAYSSGTASEFANCFDPVWGRVRPTRRVTG